MICNYKPLLIAALLCISYFTMLGQDNDTLEIQRSENGKISFARLRQMQIGKFRLPASF
jgi:hypothetical protein